MRDFESIMISRHLEAMRLQPVHEAFDRDALKRVCEMHETEFAAAYDMEVVHVDQRAPSDFYLFQDNGSNILAVAHLDTVADHDTRGAQIIDTEAGMVIFSRALDDRLGAYVILELLPKLGLKFDLLLTVGEEDGMSTASYFEPPAGKDYHWVIEFDRGGTDVVMYQYEDKETEALVKASGAKVGSGSFSDISYLEHLEVKCFNWGVGYQGDYHGPRAHAFLEDTFSMVAKFLKFHEANAEEYLPHEEQDPWWSRSWRSGSSSWWMEEEEREREALEAEVVDERPCDREFGFHDHDDAECARLLDAMKIGVSNHIDWEQDAYNREAEETMLGRPLFPNEH